MYLHYNLRNVKARRVSDAGSASEFYFTYQVYSEEGDTSFLHQGFSSGCPIDDGYRMKSGEQRELNDPKFTVALPELAEGETRLLTLDLFCWESDHSSDDVKKVFTNLAAEKIWKIHETHQDDKKAARKELLDWLLKDDNELVKLVIDGASGLSPYVAIAKASVPLLKWVISEIRNNSDDLIGTSRTELFYRKQNGRYRYRWLIDNGVETWIDAEEAPYFHEHTFLEASGGNEVAAKVIYQTVSDADRFLL